MEGKIRWERSYDNCDCDYGASICQTQDNGFLILSSGMTLIKTDENGLELERTDFNGEALSSRCVMQASDGDMFLQEFLKMNLIILKN